MTAHVRPAGLRAPPVVAVRRHGHCLTLEKCPYCGELHMHGSGGKEGVGRPGPWHGHRLAHCWRPEAREHISTGYYLVEISKPDVPTPEAALRRWLATSGFGRGEIDVLMSEGFAALLRREETPPSASDRDQSN
jgi:hypothetical protein